MTKRQKEERCKFILHSGASKITNPEDFEFLMEIFRLHKDWNIKKKGQDIIGIEIRIPESAVSNKYPLRKCFHIIREDGSMAKISYRECIYPKSRKEDVMAACRTAIRPTKEEYIKGIKFPIECPITKKTLYSIKEAQVDHYDLTFEDLFDEWVRTFPEGIDYLYNFVNKTSDRDIETRFESQEIIDNFVAFHNSHTHLRVVSIEANNSLLRKKKSNL